MGGLTLALDNGAETDPIEFYKMTKDLYEYALGSFPAVPVGRTRELAKTNLEQLRNVLMLAFSNLPDQSSRDPAVSLKSEDPEVAGGQKLLLNIFVAAGVMVFLAGFAVSVYVGLKQDGDAGVDCSVIASLSLYWFLGFLAFVLLVMLPILGEELDECSSDQTVEPWRNGNKVQPTSINSSSTHGDEVHCCVHIRLELQ